MGKESRKTLGKKARGMMELGYCHKLRARSSLCLRRTGVVDRNGCGPTSHHHREDQKQKPIKRIVVKRSAEPSILIHLMADILMIQVKKTNIVRLNET
jgi:hypothetical protein